MEPQDALRATQEWLTTIGTVAALLSAAVIALAKLYRDTRKKLHAVLRGVEESGPAAKMAVSRHEKDAGVELDKDIHAATGRMTRKLEKLTGGGAVVLIALTLGGCCSHPGTIRRLRIYQAVNEGHAADKTLPRQAREIGADNAAVMAITAQELGGPKAKDEHRKRVKR